MRGIFAAVGCVAALGGVVLGQPKPPEGQQRGAMAEQPAFDLSKQPFEQLLEENRRRCGVERDIDLPVEEMQALVRRFKDHVSAETGRAAPTGRPGPRMERTPRVQRPLGSAPSGNRAGIPGSAPPPSSPG